MFAGSTSLIAISAFSGLMLLSSAILKFQHTSVNNHVHDLLALAGGGGLASWVNIAGITHNAILGSWLLLGWRTSAAWIVAIATFGIYSAVSFTAVLAGHSRCDCFGIASGRPEFAMALDLFLLATLVVIAVRNALWTDLRRARWHILAFAGIVAAPIAAAPIAAVAVASDLEESTSHVILERLRSQPFAAGSPHIAMGLHDAGSVVTVEVKIYNLSQESIAIIGGTTNCSCTTLSGLPIAISSGQSALVPILVRFPKEPGLVTIEAKFLVASTTIRPLEVVLHGRVRPMQ